MSGGHFDYQQYKINYIAVEIEHLIETNESTEVNEYGEARGRRYSKETIEEFRNAVRYLKLAAVYAQRVDWLVSGDDGEETFHSRLEKDLSELSDMDEQPSKIRRKCNIILLALLGHDSMVSSWWWASPNLAFDGQTPETVFAKDPRQVLEYLMGFV